MQAPDFFRSAPTILMRDPLSELLGAAQGGVIEYTYADVVKLAGHSCPTVAGAYLMTRAALGKLYGEELPLRGGIRVDFQDELTNGVTGVIANVVSFITGATADNGFKGLAGKYDRRNLLFFNASIPGSIRYTRVDTGAQVVTSFHSQHVPGAPDLMSDLRRILADDAGEELKRSFALNWQDRVRRILENADHPALITCA
ncbi:hypothetical protein [Parapusillimonas granuli]|uniref:Formylmethanofuran dehydrogenase subunit E domain-containing protein n=1 Tax=Parapusillimonas granuli TaxID=380911 RepID=A0A853G2P4_9BURK|nr:hypothetical protein [Parapusillimonas granuli]MBB5214826.1 hypothetical protein [Parapusillimonas granuli]MEB2397926.1 hypothetical protein [Alcaligenaceae bacterium]NYT48766.1 hypothetical protein [Parapusillimonas granuli]